LYKAAGVQGCSRFRLISMLTDGERQGQYKTQLTVPRARGSIRFD
jgi:hypothetical protein